MERLFQAKLDRLEAEYAETILAGERAEERRRLEAVATPEVVAHYELVADENDKAAADQAFEDVPPIEPSEYKPLTSEEVEKIKNDMASIQMKYVPSWALNVSDAQLVDALKRV